MKKKIGLLLVAALLISVPNCTNADGATKVEINGKQVVYTKEAGAPFVDDAGRTQVPFRQTMETYGCTVSWDGTEQMAIAQKDGITVEVPIGQPYIYRNGTKVENDTAALIQDGRTYLPIRVVLESFGAKVQWNGDTNTVVVTSGGQTTGNGDIQVHFLDVGQGDAALINDGEFEILIDAGVSAEGTKVVQYLSDYVDGDLDVVVPLDYAADTAAQNITLPSGATLEFLPITDVYDNANDNSVVTMLTYGDVEVLFTGDLSSDVADANSSLFSDVDVLKAGHHGSRTSVSSQFLQTTKPEYVVISAGLDNSYGHPHKEALSAYLDTGADVYGTFRSGDIVMTTDGQQISFDTTEKLTLSDVGAKSTGTTPAQKPAAQPEQPAKPTTETTVTYIGNKNSKIFHRASCSSVSQMKDSNKVSLSSRDAAISQGYRPCENCQP